MKRLALLACFLLALTPAASATNNRFSSKQVDNVYSTSFNGTVSNIACSSGGTPTATMSVEVQSLNPQDVIIVAAQEEDTNNNGSNIDWYYWVAAASTSSGTSAILSGTDKLEIITPNKHHDVGWIWWIDTGESGTVYYNWVSDCVGSSSYTLQPNYGEIYIAVLRR
jgi:hypothetical protein